METKTCGKCGACWIGGQLYWATGAQGKNEDLAGLVCNKLGDHQCINPNRGDITGDSWTKRVETSKALSEELGDSEKSDGKS